MSFKKTPLLIVISIVFIGIFLFGVFGAGGFFVEDIKDKSRQQMESSLDVEKIRREMNKMTVDEIEETISKIEQEISRLESQMR